MATKKTVTKAKSAAKSVVRTASPTKAVKAVKKAVTKVPAKKAPATSKAATKPAPVKKAAASKVAAKAKPVAKKVVVPTRKVAAKAATQAAVVEKKKAVSSAKPDPTPADLPVAGQRPAKSPVNRVPAVKNPASKKAPPAAAEATSRPAARPAKSTPAVLANVANLSDDDIRAMSDDDYMNDMQIEFFRLRLLKMREEVLARELDVKERLHQREVFADPADRATAEEEHWLDLRLRERESMLLRKIDESMRRIRDKEYGYCTKTGEAIGIPRLLARPTASVCVDVKGQDEKVETHFRDRT